MKKNYYEILEVDKNASYEIIRKAYNTLAKKYHPDLQPDEKKNIAEEEIKLINEAYDIIGKEESRKQYDLTLRNNYVSIDDYNKICLENENLKNIIRNMRNNSLSPDNNIYNTKKVIHSPKIYTQKDYNQPNYNDNDYYLENKFINSIKSIIAFILTVIVLFILWNIPFIQNIIKSLFYI